MFLYCSVSAKFGPLMIFLKRWFAYNKITQGDIYEYQKEAIVYFPKDLSRHIQKKLPPEDAVIAPQSSGHRIVSMIN